MPDPTLGHCDGATLKEEKLMFKWLQGSRFNLSPENRTGAQRERTPSAVGQGLSDGGGHFAARLQLIWRGKADPGRLCLSQTSHGGSQRLTEAHSLVVLLTFSFPLFFQNEALS